MKYNLIGRLFNKLTCIFRSLERRLREREVERAREKAGEARRDVREREWQERRVMRGERERSVQNTL